MQLEPAVKSLAKGFHDTASENQESYGSPHTAGG